MYVSFYIFRSLPPAITYWKKFLLNLPFLTESHPCITEWFFPTSSPPGSAIPMDPGEAAAAVFPSMARPLQKYLRVTRQQPRYTMDAVLAHLALCISHDMSPRAFLSKYLNQGAVVCGNEQEVRGTERWVVVCEQLLTREVDHDTTFVLKKGLVSLLCTATRLPHLSLTEEVQHPKSNRFVLRLNSETSVWQWRWFG